MTSDGSFHETSYSLVSTNYGSCCCCLKSCGDACLFVRDRISAILYFGVVVVVVVVAVVFEFQKFDVTE